MTTLTDAEIKAMPYVHGNVNCNDMIEVVIYVNNYPIRIMGKTVCNTQQDFESMRNAAIARFNALSLPVLSRTAK